jgi:hypothetical protein
MFFSILLVVYWCELNIGLPRLLLGIIIDLRRESDIQRYSGHCYCCNAISTANAADLHRESSHELRHTLDLSRPSSSPPLVIGFIFGCRGTGCRLDLSPVMSIQHVASRLAYGAMRAQKRPVAVGMSRRKLEFNTTFTVPACNA